MIDLLFDNFFLLVESRGGVIKYFEVIVSDLDALQYFLLLTLELIFLFLDQLQLNLNLFPFHSEL